MRSSGQASTQNVGQQQQLHKDGHFHIGLFISDAATIVAPLNVKTTLKLAVVGPTENPITAKFEEKKVTLNVKMLRSI